MLYTFREGYMLNKENEKLMQKVLMYIERESVNLDAEDLNAIGLFQVFQFVQKMTAEALFIQMHQVFQDLSEELLEQESRYFYNDCMIALTEDVYINRKEHVEGVSEQQFYDEMIKFIECIRGMKIRKEMGKELKQLYQMLKNVSFLKDAPSKWRYVEKDENSEIDVRNQTKRFWVKCIGGHFCGNSMKIQNSEHMDREEMIFWILIALIINFANSFGDEEMKELKKCFSHKQYTKFKDISDALNWCYRCLFEIYKYGDEILTDYMGESLGINGLLTLSQKFHYQKFRVRNQLRKELEDVFKHPKKIFTTCNANDMVFKIRLDELGAFIHLAGETTKAGYISIDNRYITRALKTWLGEEWVDKTWFDIKAKGDENSLESQINLHIDFHDRQVNIFFACELLRLLHLCNSGRNLFFLSEKHLFFSQLIDMMFSGELKEEDIFMGLAVEIKISNGEKIETDAEDDAMKEKAKKEMAIKECALLKGYSDILNKASEWISLYRIIVKDIIIGRKKIKVSESLAKELVCKSGMDEFYIDENGCISWEKCLQEEIDETLQTSIMWSVFEAYGWDLNI